jgi:enoyl-CoA hydratase/carnithine racemase
MSDEISTHKHDTATILTEKRGSTLLVTINRPEVKNALDAPTASALAQALREFDHDEELAVAVLNGSGGTFCSGFDLKAVAEGTRMPHVSVEGDGPLGVTRMLLSKPIIAAIEGFAVAGGLEVALWCDLRVAADNAIFGVFNRRWGVPLVDGGTIRLPRLIGQSHALDLILTGRSVSGPEALSMGLVNRLTRPGETLATALAMASDLARFPQQGLRSDRLSVYEQWSLSWEEAFGNETRRGLFVLGSGESVEGARRFAAGHGRHGSVSDI